jgi:uncharacterized protein (DUF302 family)
MADDQKDFEEKIKKLNARLKDKNSNINTKRSVAEFLNSLHLRERVVKVMEALSLEEKLVIDSH